MNRNLLDGLLIALTLGGIALTVRRAGPVNVAAAVVSVPPAVSQTATSHTSATSAGASVVETDPFRLSRKPALIRVGQPITVSYGTPSGPPPKLRPVMTVKAIVGGPPWSALVDGLPQTTGSTVVREGVKFGEVTIRAISRDTVVIASADTVWNLTVKRGPQ